MERIYPLIRRALPENGRNLLKWPEKFQSEQPHIAGYILSQHFGRYRWSFIGHKAGRYRGRCRNRKVYDLVGTQRLRRSDACPYRAYVQGFGQFDEFHTRTIRPPQEYRYLQ